MGERITPERATVSVLGPTRIEGIVLTGQQRTLIAAMALHRQRGVTTDRLVDILWFDIAPRAARQSVQNQIGRLRRRFGPDLIATDPNGYRLGPATDAEVFTAVVTGVLDRAPDIGDAARLDEALALWAGTPYLDLDDDPLIDAERTRLAELYIQGLVRRAESRILAGQDRHAVLDLRQVTSAAPYDEAAWALLMHALHLGGRRAEALAAYDAAVRHLADLGGAPSAALRSQRYELLDVQSRSSRPPAPGPSRRTCQQRGDLSPRRWCAPLPG